MMAVNFEGSAIISVMLVKELLEAKASADTATATGETALMIAAASARVGVVKELLAAKASTTHKAIAVRLSTDYSVC